MLRQATSRAARAVRVRGRASTLARPVPVAPTATDARGLATAVVVAALLVDGAAGARRDLVREVG